MTQSADVLKTLEQVGLTEKEAKIYLALAGAQSCTAYEVSQRCDVKKPTVYVTLEELRRKGLVLKVPHAKKALFAARDLSEYLAEQRGKIKAAEAIIPRLLSLGGGYKPNVYFFNGLSGMRDALGYKFEQMRGKTFHSFFGNLAASDEGVRTLYGELDARAVAAGISYDIIMGRQKNSALYQHVIDLARQEPDRFRVRFVDGYSYPGNIAIEIGEDFIRINDAKRVNSTIIDDEATAAAMRQIFEVVWQSGKAA